MKVCSACEVSKDLDQFGKASDRKDGLKARCKECARASQRSWFLSNKEKRMKQIKTNMRRWKDELHREIDELKSAPCQDCGRTFPPCAMDFDHRDGATKLDCISHMIGSGTRSRQRIYEEIAKCDLVCACCHRVRTYNRSKAIVVQLAERPPD